VAYQLALPLSWGIHNVFHASLLLPYKETTAHGPNFTQPPLDLIAGEEEYEVEAIINHRHHGHRRQLQYLIKWRGYPSLDNTWETVEDVHMDDLVKEYHRCHPLGAVKSKINQGTRKLARALQLFTIPLSPIQKIMTWLLNEEQPKVFPRIPIASLRENRFLSKGLSCSSPSPLSESCKRLSWALVSTMPGDSFRTSLASCGHTEKASKVTDLRRMSPRTLGRVLARMLCWSSTHPGTSPCKIPTPSSGRGHPL